MTKADLAIICLILLSAIFSFFFSFCSRTDSNHLIISLNNEIYATISLKEESQIKIDDLVVIEINEKKARITFSTCKNQHCVTAGWSNRQPIICVPNKIMLEFSVEDTNKGDRIFITR